MAVENPQKYILWDWGGTLASINQDPKLRRDLEQVLIRLENFEETQSVIVSGGDKQQIQASLTNNHLERHFQRIYDRTDLRYYVDHYSKDYLGVLTDLGVEKDRASYQCLVVSDKKADSPHTQLIDNVFIHQPDGYHTSAYVIRDIARSLLEAGEGLFDRGFYEMHCSVTDVDTRLKLGSGRVRLDNGLQFTTRYLNVDGEEEQFIKPVISEISLPRDYKPISFSVHLPSTTASV